MKRLLEADYAAFLSAYENPVPRGLRVNTLKCSAERLKELFPHPLAPAPFAADGYLVEEEFRAGADPLHHAGAYYMQEPSAMSAVTVLRPVPGERVLDLCAAPGGKSTQIAAALQGRGLLWANEFVRPRAHILAQNIERCGVRNAVVSCADVHSLCSKLSGFFDAVLVDAPCSGEGMFRKEPEALAQWGGENIRLCARRQRGILSAAAGAVRPGGRLVYSTCTFAPEENEEVVAEFLAAHPEFSLEDSGVAFGRPGFPSERVREFDPGWTSRFGAPLSLPLEKTRRVFPGDGGEGHFVARMKKDGAERSEILVPESSYNDTNRNNFIKLYNECFLEPLFGKPYTIGNFVRLLPAGLPDCRGLGVLAAGVAAAEIRKNRLEPCHALFMAASGAHNCVSSLDLTPGDPRLTAFLRGETIEAPGCGGWTAVSVEGVVTGFGKVSGGILKNHYPKGLRLLSR